MRCKLISILYLFIFLLLIHAGTGVCQSTRKGIILVKSEPPGAMVYLQGENSFVGVTPFKLAANFHGIYRITTSKKGYEKQNHVYLFNGDERGILKLNLIPKTPTKAAIRSCFVPGWGQYYSERKFSGVLINALEIFSLIGMGNAIRHYNADVSAYETALKLYEKNKQSYYLRDQYWNNVVNLHAKADDTFDKRQKWIVLACSVWLYNILDAFLFFPSFDEEIFNRTTPSLSSEFQNGTAKVTLSMQF